MRLLIMISEFSVSNEKNVFTFEKLFENKSNDENEQDDRSTINAFISSIRSIT